VFTLLFALAGARAGWAEAPTFGTKTPIARVLNADGTLNLAAGFSGTLDPAGYRMEKGPGGIPRFLSETSAAATAPPTAGACNPDANWDNRFYPIGSAQDGYPVGVHTVAVSGTDVYVGGAFSVMTDIVANNVARWDGTAWSALGSGTSGAVATLAVIGTDLYAGGGFKKAGGLTVNGIAKWDGTNWSALGSGMNNNVYVLVADGTDLYAGGAFTSPAARVAKWDGTSWSALGSGMDDWVATLALSGGDLYAGGAFTSPANHVAKWNGTSWSSLGTGTDDWVAALAASGSYLYAGGAFTTAGAASANYVAMWDGTDWSALGSGMDGNTYALTVSGSYLYVGGAFTTAGGVSANRLAKWNGEEGWSAIDSGTNGDVRALRASGSELYVGGEFTTAGGAVANRIVKWDGMSWSPLYVGPTGLGMSHGVYAVAVSGSDVYVAGDFDTAGDVPANRIAKWDGTGWSPLGAGIDGLLVHALAASGSELYAGGGFSTAGGVSANNVAKWDGTSWSALGSGTDGGVYVLALSGSDLYAGGAFTNAGGVSANNIAKWNGTGWSALGTGTNAVVYALAVSGSDLYAGGLFTDAGGASVNYVAKWGGTSWSPLGSGMNELVSVLAMRGSELYAGGWFMTAGGAPANHIAKWDGSAWSSLADGVLGDGLNDEVLALHVEGDDVYVGGNFDTASGAAASNIAKWNGATWSALGSGMTGVTPYVQALAVSGDYLYAGGYFGTAGGKVSSGFARWQLGCGNCVVESGEQCDDGNTTAGGCCSPTCQFDPGGTACADDGQFCNGAETCDAVGNCTSHSGDPCTSGLECNNTCNETADDCLTPNGTPCDDGSTCTISDTCSSGLCSGTPQLATGCHPAGKSMVRLRKGIGDAENKLLLKWLRGTASPEELADPVNSSGYRLCIFDDTGLVLGAEVPPAGSCNDRPCWSGTRRGYRYRDQVGLSDGISRITLAGHESEGRAKVIVKGDGPFLMDPILRTTATLTAQVVNEERGVCMESTYSGGQILVNSDFEIKAEAP
jgi:cysteine-rich repeat protein